MATNLTQILSFKNNFQIDRLHLNKAILYTTVPAELPEDAGVLFRNAASFQGLLKIVFKNLCFVTRKCTTFSAV